MQNTLLVIDTSYLAHRAHWTCNGLFHAGQSTGMLYGFWCQLQKLLRMFDNARVVFAWDSKKSIRKDFFDDYKANRNDRIFTAEEIQSKAEFRQQMEILQSEILEPLGFRNHIHANGYEADDIIASVCQWAQKKPRQIAKTYIISSDHDMYQLLHLADIYQPHADKYVTAQDIKKVWDIEPTQWSDVLAIAGCDTDNVPGVFGVGFKTAAKYITGKKIRPTQLSAIEKATKKIERNLRLVRLPLDGKNLVPSDFFLEMPKALPGGIARVRERYGFKKIWT